MKDLQYLLVFALVELFVIVFLVLQGHVLNTSTTISKTNLQVGKRDESLFDTRLENHKIIGINNNNNSKSESIILNHLLRKHPITDENFDKTGSMSSTNGDIIQDNENVHIKAFRQRDEESYLISNGNDISLGNETIRNVDSKDSFNENDVSNKTSKNKTICTFFFDKNSLLLARQIISVSKSVYLFYIRLDLQDDEPSKFNSTEKEILFHWQYVLKKEKYLVQLPVDFDLITYFLLKNDDEESFLKIKLFYNNSNCEKKFSTALQDIQNLLWTDLSNDTDFYFCYRNIPFQTQLRDYLYYITTIWVGHNLHCYDYNGNEQNLNKDQLPLVIPIFCYMLSLQFIWIVVILDKKESYQISSDNCYSKSDRPYGAKQIIKKILFVDRKSPCEQNFEENKSISGWKNWLLHCWIALNVLNSPAKKLFLLLYFILLPVAIYRTVGRDNLLEEEYFNDYIKIIRPSEPLFYHWTEAKERYIIFDCIYATVFPLLFIWIGELQYKLFINHNVHLYACKFVIKFLSKYAIDIFLKCCYCGNYESRSKATPAETDETKKLVQNQDKRQCLDCINKLASACQQEELDNNRVIDAFSIPCRNMYKSVCCSCENMCNKCQKVCKEARTNFNTDQTENMKVLAKMKVLANNTGKMIRGLYPDVCIIILNCLFNFIKKIVCVPFILLCCLFPILFFNCNYRYVCKHCKDKKDERPCNIVLFAIRKSFVLLCFLCLISFSYCFCLRPMLSSFTFIIRSFTYFVFVALLIRTHIMRYTLIIVTTFIYFVKYLSEIINMNAEILNHIFHLEADVTENIEEKKTEKIEEKKFDYIYAELSFVRNRIYHLCLKILVVFMYIFITVETFKQNQESLTGSSFDYILEFLLLILGPYAISVFLKTDKGNFLSDEDKDEIKTAFNSFKNASKESSTTAVDTPSSSDSQVQSNL